LSRSVFEGDWLYKRQEEVILREEKRRFWVKLVFLGGFGGSLRNVPGEKVSGLGT
jgi:hypothetical protein